MRRAGAAEATAQAGHEAGSALARLVNPRAVALVGASPDAAKLAGRPLGYLRRYGFAGIVHPVNPKYDAIDGVRCHPSIESLPDGVDLALILLPARATPEAVEACNRRGIPFAISIAGGFAEAGDAALQARLEEALRSGATRLVGPNCVGLLNPRAGVAATFSTVLKGAMPRPGRLALVTQSGALGNSLLQSFLDHDVGLATWVSTGNEVDLGALELVHHFLDDPDVDTVALFVEGLKDGAGLVPLGRRARALGKTIVVLRAGRSQLGRQAAASHTGKLAGSARVWRDLARQAGLTEVDSLDALLDLVAALELFGRPASDAADGLGVLTISGGLGVLISDAAAERDLPLPRFAEATQARLRGVLPAQMGVMNPVDTALFTDEGGYATCADAVLADPGVGTLLLVLTSLAHDYAALLPWLERLGEGARGAGKHVAITYLSSSDPMPREALSRLRRAGILVLPTAERVVAALARRREAGLPLPEGPRETMAARGEANQAGFIARAGVPLVGEILARDPDSAMRAARQLGFPVAAKIVSPDIAHKTEVGGVRVGLADEAAVHAAVAGILSDVAAKAPAARVEGVAVQAMIPPGLELLVGCSVDPEMGRIVAVGAGGIWAEILEDIAFLAAPCSREEVEAALGRLKLGALLDGARGGPRRDRAAVARIVARLSQQFAAETWVAEVDVNPLIVLAEGEGAVAVDTLVVARATSAEQT